MGALLLLKFANYWKPIAAVVAVVALLATVYYRGKSACKTEIIQEKVYIYEKANVVKNRVNRLPDGESVKRLRAEWQRGGV